MGIDEKMTLTTNFDASNLSYENIPLSKIELDPDNPRELKITILDLINGISQDDPSFYDKQKDKVSLETLANSIKSKGVINPIWVYKGSDKYMLVVGERRVLGSILAGKDNIPAKIMTSKPQENDLRVIQWIENVERADLSLWERLKNVEMIIGEHKKIYKNDVINASLIKKLLGCSLTHAVNYFTVLYADTKLKDVIKNGIVNNLEKASLLASISDNKAFFEELIELTIKGISLSALKQRVRSQKELTQSIHLINIRAKHSKRMSKVNLGSTQNLSVVKTIFNAVLDYYPKYRENYETLNNINWEDHKSVSVVFKKLIKIIENNIS
jgi:ParB family chromosome partitioning protein